jgi:hypothetical protein
MVYLLNIHIVWIFNIQLVSFNLMLICIYRFGSRLPLFPRMLFWSFTLCYHTSPALILIWEILSRNLYSLWYINSRIVWFYDTFWGNKCFW